MQNLSSKVGTFLFLLSLTACSGGGSSVPKVSQQADSELHSTLAAPALGSTARLTPNAEIDSSSGSDVVEIDAGSRSAVDNWKADTDYAGGAISTVHGSINTSSASNPAPESVYQTQRYATNFSYTIPGLTAQGAYSVRLHFAETFWSAAGRRVFNVKINGTQVLTGFDVFKAAGGANIAIVKQFATNADGSGKITVQFIATADNAAIAGIEILNGSSGSGTPTPEPSPIAGGSDALPWVYSELWAGSSPFNTTVAEHMSHGAHVVSHSYVNSLWSQGIAGNGTAAAIPIYVAKSSDPLVTMVCTKYGGNCNANDKQIHFPSYAIPQQASDGHISVIDNNAPSGSIEVDCWQGVKSGKELKCSWAGAFSLGGSGVSENGSEGIHGGMAVSSVYMTGAELENGHIDHALGLATSCLNNKTVYPADMTNGTDTSCGSSNPPHYGNLMHLLWSSSQIANSAYSAPCKVVLTALAKYGAYLDGTGNNGLQINVQNELSYTADSATSGQDPWPSLQSKLNAGGDGSSHNWHSCLNRLDANDFELIEIAQP